MKQALNATAYLAVLNPIPDDAYEVSFPDFPGCVTFEDALEKGAEVLSLWIEELEAQHQTIPEL